LWFFALQVEVLIMRHPAGFLAVLLVTAVFAPSAVAHFKLLEPQSWLAENDLGDPQKMAPCGGTSANAGTPSGLVNKIQGGSKLHIKVQETVFHPGHYRVALAVTRTELPKDPEVTTRESARGPWSVSAVIQNPVRPPVLADGLWAHTTRPTAPFETDIDIPNINCEKCTLQIIQFMAEHGLNRDGDYSYHHCADLQITADPAKPLDARWTVPAGRGQR
jgi:hypothetical protein